MLLMENGTFMNIVASNYNKIKSLFTSRLYNMNMYFNEDLFNDTFIKCANKFKNEQISYDITVKYFWTAYLNTIKTDLAKTDNLNTELIDEEIHDCIDDVYNEFYDDDYAKNVYNIIMNAVTLKYGEDEMLVYSLYKYHNWTEKDLILAGYNCDKLSDRIKKIHRFVKEYSKKHITK